MSYECSWKNICLALNQTAQLFQRHTYNIFRSFIHLDFDLLWKEMPEFMHLVTLLTDSSGCFEEIWQLQFEFTNVIKYFLKRVNVLWGELQSCQGRCLTLQKHKANKLPIAGIYIVKYAEELKNSIDHWISGAKSWKTSNILREERLNFVIKKQNQNNAQKKNNQKHILVFQIFFH